MAAGLIMKFGNGSIADYHKVSAKLNIDMNTGHGDWPEGLLSHAGGEVDGALCILEVWESREAQERFMNGRLGRAIQEAGVDMSPPEITWIDLVSYYTPGKVPA